MKTRKYLEQELKYLRAIKSNDRADDPTWFAGENPSLASKSEVRAVKLVCARMASQA